MPGSPPELFVLGEIASGGMGSVELARLGEAAEERLVAVKRMHPEYARDQEFVRMFRDEIWLMGALSHDNVVRLFGWGEDEGGPYLVMEFIEGAALGTICSTGKRAGERIAPELVAFVAARAAEGLHAAHMLTDDKGKRLEIVHRDITPSNVIVGFDGSVRITDFGIAKAAGKSTHTRTGIIKGKIAYMAPEYAARREVEPRSDLYSLGVVMFELLSGGLPFVARTDFELLKLVAYAAPPSLLEAAPKLDPALAAVVDGLLAKAADARPADGAALAASLDGWLERSGNRREDLARRLGEYATRYGEHRRKAIEKLRAAPPDENAEDGEILRPRLASLGTATFTFFQPLADFSGAASGEDTESKPRTRRVAVSEFPHSSPVSAPAPPLPSAPVQSVPLGSSPRTPPRGTGMTRAIEPPRTALGSAPSVASVPRPPPVPDSSPRSVPPPARASVPPPPASRRSAPPPASRRSAPPPDPNRRSRSSIAPPTPTAMETTSRGKKRARPRASGTLIAAAVVSSVVAFALVVLTAPLVFKSSTPAAEAAAPALPAIVPAAEPPATAPTAASSAVPSEEPLKTTAAEDPPAERVPAASAGSALPVRKPDLSGKTPRQTGIVSGTPRKPGKPCTPDSFDYPACLSGRR